MSSVTTGDKRVAGLKKLLIANRAELTENIVLNASLWDRLIAAYIVTTEVRESIQERPSTDKEKIGRLLEHLQKRPDNEIDLFCKCLRNTNQAHIVQEYLTPSKTHPNSTSGPHKSDQDSSDNCISNNKGPTPPELAIMGDSVSRAKKAETPLASEVSAPSDQSGMADVSSGASESMKTFPPSETYQSAGTAEEIHDTCEPCQLLAVDENGGCHLNQAAVDKLKQLTNPCVVVAIAGPYRSGKSFLLNKLANLRQGFKVSGSTKAETQGLWMLIQRHPKENDFTIIYLDTEGIDNPKEEGSPHLKWILSFTLLLSSALVFNTKGVFTGSNLKHLEWISSLSDNLTSQTGDEGFDMYFPQFILCLRDFHYKDETADEYFEYHLTHRLRETEKEAKLLFQYFPKRKCFTFETPTTKYGKLDEGDDSVLTTEFREQLKVFRDYILEDVKVKELITGERLTGYDLGSICESLTDVIIEGQKPNVTDIIHRIRGQRSSFATEKAAEEFHRMLEKECKPIDREELLSRTQKAFVSAINMFLDLCAFNEMETPLFQLCEMMRDEADRYYKELCRQSCQLCKETLEELHKDISNKLATGHYNHPCKYSEYPRDMMLAIHTYVAHNNLGLQKWKRLKKFLEQERVSINKMKKMAFQRDPKNIRSNQGQEQSLTQIWGKFEKEKMAIEEEIRKQRTRIKQKKKRLEKETKDIFSRMESKKKEQADQTSKVNLEIINANRKAMMKLFGMEVAGLTMAGLGGLGLAITSTTAGLAAGATVASGGIALAVIIPAALIAAGVLFKREHDEKAKQKASAHQRHLFDSDDSWSDPDD